MSEKKEQWVEPAEDPATHEKIKALLDEAKVQYKVTTHEPVLTSDEAAKVRGVSLDSGAKAIILKDSGKKLALEGAPFYLAILSASKKFNSKHFGKLINVKKFRFATPEEVWKTTGCLPGAVPPFGKTFGFPTWVDRSLSRESSINFNCGLRTHSITMDYADWLKVEKPTEHVFTDEEIALGGAPEMPKTEQVDDRAAKKKARMQQMQKKAAAAEENVKDPNDPSAALFGERELNRSQGDPELRFSKTFTEVGTLDASCAGKEVVVRGRLHNSRPSGNLCFIVIRQQYASIQAVLQKSDLVSKGMVTYAGKVPKESIIEVVATVIVPEKPVATCSQKVELAIKSFFVVNKSAPVLPFQLEDASRVVTDQAAEDGAAKDEEQKDGEKVIVVKQDVRLNNRIIDLRVPTNQAIFKLQSGVCRLYREFMIDNGFVEIHSPKMIGGASEGGANVFHFEYFGQPACMAQSPQLYKQMALCADFDRVFEIGPVFRAEDSNTNRHLCEFTGLDMEMTIKEHYFEVLDMLANLLVHIFGGLERNYAKELEVIGAQYPFEPFVCKEPVVRLTFKEGVEMLRAAGYEQEPLEDLSTETEKALGRMVKEKHGTDFYMLYGYPANARPFYTMLDPVDPNYTNSYDFFMRGEEITSGAQRIHDPKMLTERAKHFGIPVETIKDYIDSFKYGAPAHGGAGFGLERIVKFYCNLHNIRKSSLFPRDPKRLAP